MFDLTAATARRLLLQPNARARLKFIQIQVTQKNKKCGKIKFEQTAANVSIIKLFNGQSIIY